MGPLNAAWHRDSLADQLQDAVDRARRSPLAGNEHDGKGYFFEPTVIENAPHDSRVVREETLGPLLPVFKVNDVIEAIRLATDSPYGLGLRLHAQREADPPRSSGDRGGHDLVNQPHFGYDEPPSAG